MVFANPSLVVPIGAKYLMISLRISSAKNLHYVLRADSAQQFHDVCYFAFIVKN